MKKVGLVVTTKNNGVFFGYGVPTENATITLDQCRMCIYWSEETHGVVGLAGRGPQRDSKVTPAAPSAIINDITAVMNASQQAIKAWESEPWL